jgi:hypothetical protein
MIYSILVYRLYMNLKYLRQCIDELRKCKDERTTRSKEQAYLEKCREFVEILIDSNILYEFAEVVVDDNNMSVDDLNPNNIQHIDTMDTIDNTILNQYHIDCNNYYMSVYNQYQASSEKYYTSLFDKYRFDSYDYYTSIVNQYQVDSEAYYADILNQYQLNSETYYTSILNQYQTENEKYCIWYEKELNEYYTDCLRTLCWEYYTNVEKNQVDLNRELVIKNRDLVAHNKTLQEFETNYNSLLSQNKNNTLLLNSMKNEYKEIYRRLLIMISQYNKLYIAFEKYKKTGLGDEDNIPEKTNDMNDTQEIPDDYDYIDME